MWTGYQKNLDALATFDDVCAYQDSTLPQCAAAQALAPFRYIVSVTTAVQLVARLAEPCTTARLAGALQL